MRDWRPSDARALVRHADNRAVWLQLRDRFPHPYTLHDADVFLARVCRETPRSHFAICVEGAACGGVALELGDDVSRATAELGYWLGEAHWGRGLMTRVVRDVTVEMMSRFHLHRIFALPFARNAASARVLEKAGYRLEGRMRRSAVKEGEVLDQLLYAITDQDLAGTA